MVTDLKLILIFCLVIGAVVVGQFLIMLANEFVQPKEMDLKFFQYKFIFMVDLSGGIMEYCQACAVESARIKHPSRTVYFFRRLINGKDPLLKVLSKQQNLRVSGIKPGDYFVHTPLEAAYKKLLGDDDAFVNQYLPIVMINSFGGVYLSVNKITLQPLPGYGNFLQRKGDDEISRDIFGFHSGHPLLNLFQTAAVEKEKYQRNISRKNYDIFRRIFIREFCNNSTSPTSLIPDMCHKVSVLPPTTLPLVDCNSLEVKRKNMPESQRSDGEQENSHSRFRFKDVAKDHCPTIYKIFTEQ